MTAAPQEIRSTLPPFAQAVTDPRKAWTAERQPRVDANGLESQVGMLLVDRQGDLPAAIIDHRRLGDWLPVGRAQVRRRFKNETSGKGTARKR